MAIGGDHADAGPVALEQRAGQVRPRVVAGHGVLRERDELGEHAGVELDEAALAGAGQRREVFARHAGDAELDLASAAAPRFLVDAS